LLYVSLFRIAVNAFPVNLPIKARIKPNTKLEPIYRKLLTGVYLVIFTASTLREENVVKAPTKPVDTASTR
jgi:hypothetical protein